MRLLITVLVVLILTLCLIPANADTNPRLARLLWQTEPVFQTPEAVLYDAKRDVLIVGNYKKTEDQENGEFLSRVNTHGKVLDLKWITGLNRPTGMSIHQDRLYVVERENLVCIHIDNGRIEQRFPIAGASFVNDVAFDPNGIAYISDNGQDGQTSIRRFKDGQIKPWMTSEHILRPNGLLIDGEHLVAYDNRRKALVRIHRSSQKIQTIASIDSDARGVGDGIIKLDTDTYLVTAWNGESWIINQAGRVAPLLDTNSLTPVKGDRVNHADVGYVPQQRMWVIPTFFDHRLLAYELTMPNSTAGPAQGTCILGGSGGEPEMLQRFLELAGGERARVVVIPTASEGDSDRLGQGFIGRFKDLGVESVVVLHTRDPDVANSDAFVEPLKSATGVWFGGGRQWRLVDAYMGTQTLREIRGVLQRGGVIAGGSAGATIQGSFLARGDTKGNQIMMGDHQQGFGLVKNVAVDQHLLARNRQFDLMEIVRAHPELLGIGLDEGAAIVVQGNEFEVIGTSYVVIYDYYKTMHGFGPFYFLQPGDRYDLKTRTPMQKRRSEKALDKLVEEPWPMLSR
jgi:cyanophycinase